MEMTDWIRKTGRVFWILTKSVASDDIASLAAIMAFYAFFSLFPLLILLIYALSRALPHAQTESLVLQILQPLFPAIADARNLISQNITQLASGANVGAFSAITLIWSASSGFIALQQALDVICNPLQQRSFVSRRLVGFSMLILLFAVSMVSVATMVILPVIHALPPFQNGLFAWFGWVHGLSRVVFPLSLFLACTVGFRYLPSRRIDWLYLIPGAFVTAITLDLGREAFVWYVSHLSRYHMIYGGLTAVMLLVLWLYIGSILMLFGAEVSVALERVFEPGSVRPPNDPPAPPPSA